MDRTKESYCLKKLDSILREKYHTNEYCLGGEKDSAVCLVEQNGVWNVFEQERRKKYDIKSFDTIIEACLDVISRMVLDGTVVQVKNQFLNVITINAESKSA